VPRKHNDPPRKATPAEAVADTDVRIIGGRFRGRRLRYHGDPIVRPMKHRVREAIFNLITADVVGRHVVDLFAGTGALGLEAVSRGAASATLIEKHVPTARIVEENIRALGVADRVTLLTTSAFLWGKRDLVKSQELRNKSQTESPALDPRLSARDSPWLVFCSPPYDFYVERQAEMLDLIGRIKQHAPAASLLVVEADQRFDFALLRQDWPASQTVPDGAIDEAVDWRIRAYPPAVIGIWSKR
jgi:16S rRNA (guanine966-N2)-methyltransferase